MGGPAGLIEALNESQVLGPNGLSVWGGTGLDNPTNPYGNWIGIALGMGFVNSFGYWTTNFTEVQRALSAKDMRSARLTPILAAIPKMFLPVVIIVPGLIAAVLVPELHAGELAYNEALPALIGRVMPHGLMGLALAGLIAAFMAGMAANVSAFNTVVTYDLWETYIKPHKPDTYYVKVGRRFTFWGVIIAIGTAFIAAEFSNLQDYTQMLQSIFNAPLFATFVLGMFWKRMSGQAGLWGLIAGAAGAGFVQVGYASGWLAFNSSQAASFMASGIAFVADITVSVLVTFMTKPRPIEQLDGLVWGRVNMPIQGARPAPNLAAARSAEVRERAVTGEELHWWERPVPLGIAVLLVCLIMNVVIG